ncbi:MAG: prolipoprotein diacylglyceryl transferase [Lachnospiraceae bacterium]|nr:prolipoprotein diacylglyceryl transferase [Lachnospiraceae bacterium]
MYNDLFSIGPITIHTYGLMVAIGVLAALFTGEARAKKRNMDADALYPMTFLCVVLGFCAAKVLFCIVEWKNFVQNPLSVLNNSGFVVYGGILGGVLTAYLYCRIKKLSFVDYFDLMMPSVALAQAFGRLGCFFAGCCYGRETDSFIGIAFSQSDYAPNGVKMIPTQLFSSAGMFLIAGILFRYASKERPKLKVGALYLILYSIGRFTIEFFRNDHRGAIGIFSTSQFISFFVLVLGLILFFRNQKSEEKA